VTRPPVLSTSLFLPSTSLLLPSTSLVLSLHLSCYHLYILFIGIRALFDRETLAIIYIYIVYWNSYAIIYISSTSSYGLVSCLRVESHGKRAPQLEPVFG